MNFNFLPYINMHKKYFIIGTLSLLALLTTVRVFAGADEQTKIRDRISELDEQITSNQSEYVNISTSLDKDRAYCDLAKSKEIQLAKLNGANNAKRTEMEILTGLLDDSVVATVESPL